MWKITDLDNVKKINKKVFSCFHCGGGSSFGYKLAGYDVLGGVEIDKKMMDIYRKNHNPKYSYLMGVQDFVKIDNASLPKELFELDILDGSPPCSSFSMAGSREEKWGVEKKFREGQAVQILDDLFFDFIKVAKKLQPKVVISENFKGLIQGNAKYYVKKIIEGFNEAGYDTQIFLLNAAFMEVPQKRERVFFISRRKDLKYNKIDLNFNETPISFNDATNDLPEDLTENLPNYAKKYWKYCEPGSAFSKLHYKGSLFSSSRIKLSDPIRTLTSGDAGNIFHETIPRVLNNKEWIRCQTFPDDYDCEPKILKYVIGMSVPPMMIKKIAEQVNVQMLNKYIIK